MTKHLSFTGDLAKAYKDAPNQLHLISQEDLHTFRKVVNKQFIELCKVIYFDFVDYEPYGLSPTINDIKPDFKDRLIKIHTTGNDSAVWGKFYNLQFRAVHDYFHCLYEHDFTHDEERLVFDVQYQHARQCAKDMDVNWDLFRKILRSEIIYQSAYKEIYGEFHIDQKIVLKDI